MGIFIADQTLTEFFNKALGFNLPKIYKKPNQMSTS